MIRSKKYLDGARDQACTNCGRKDGTVVAAHYQGLRALAFGKGKGIKPHDLMVADLCHTCHAEFDQYIGRSTDRDPWTKKIDMSEQFLYCVAMTMIRRHRQGLLHIEGDKSS